MGADGKYKDLQSAIIDAANRIVVPTFVSTLCICIVRAGSAENRRPRGGCLTPLLAGDQASLAEVVMRLGIVGVELKGLSMCEHGFVHLPQFAQSVHPFPAAGVEKWIAAYPSFCVQTADSGTVARDHNFITMFGATWTWLVPLLARSVAQLINDANRPETADRFDMPVAPRS